WRERLIADGDAALSELLAEHPQADRQHLRQLVRNAIDERNRNKPPHAFRELFRELRELIDEPDGTEDAVSPSCRPRDGRAAAAPQSSERRHAPLDHVLVPPTV